MTNYEYIELYYCGEGDIIKLSRYGVDYRLVAQTDRVIRLINIASNTSKLLIKSDYYKIWRKL